MFDILIPAVSRIWPLLTGVTIGCWLMIVASLWRLKSIQALDMRRRGGKRAALENAAHSIFKLFITTLCVAAVIRFLLVPNYPGGAFSIDLALLYGGLITLLASVPTIVFIALLSQPFALTKKSTARGVLVSVALLAVLFSGGGQLLSAAAFAGNDLSIVAASAPRLIAPCLLIGGVLTIGVWAHVGLMKNVLAAERAPMRIILQDAAIAVGPTFLGGLLAAAALLKA